MNQFAVLVIGMLGLTVIFSAGYLIGDLEGGNALLMWITCNMGLGLLLNHNKI
jgi:hypothetical protein